MNWTEMLVFARGPFFQVALLVFIGGMVYRLVRVVLLGWKSDHVPARGSKLGGAAVSFLKGILIWPFIPWVKNTYSRNPIIYMAGGLFHLGLFVCNNLGYTTYVGLEESDRIRMADSTHTNCGLAGSRWQLFQ